MKKKGKKNIKFDLHFSWLKAVAQTQNTNFKTFIMSISQLHSEGIYLHLFTEQMLCILRNVHCNKGVHFYSFMHVIIAGNRTHVANTMLYCLSFMILLYTV